MNKVTDSSQNGEPYVVSNAARKVLNTSSPLSEGYTVMSQSIFKNHSDHDFYDRECTAHKKLKARGSHRGAFSYNSNLQLQETTSKVRTGVMTIVTEGTWPEPKL